MGKIATPSPTALPGREERPSSDSGRVSLSSAFPSFFPFLTSSPLSCMHACAHACVHICLLVCQRPPDDRSGLGTWFLVMVYHWTDRRTDRRTHILRNTAFNFDSPYPDTHIYAHTRTQAHARSYVTRIRALSSSACECVVGVPLGIWECLCRVRRALGFKLQGIYWGISLRCLPTHGLFVTSMLRVEEVHLSIVRCPSHVAHQQGTYIHHPRRTSACPAHPYPHRTTLPPSSIHAYILHVPRGPTPPNPPFTPARKRPRDRPRGTLRGLVRDLIGLRVLVRRV